METQAPPGSPPGAKANGRRLRGAVPEFDRAIEEGSVSLDHLVEAVTKKRTSHDAHSRALHESYFSKLIKAYQADGVSIEESYFCQNLPGGALLTKRKTEKSRWRRTDDQYRIHIRYPTASVVTVTPGFAQVLWRCVALSKRATQLLRTQNSIAIHKSMYSVVVYLLSVLDTVQSEAPPPSPDADTEAGIEDTKRERIKIAIADAHRRLDEAGRHFDAATRWGSNFAYFNGMLIGLAVLGLVVLGASALISQPTSSSSTDTFLAVMSAGSAGAVVSVMTRMGSDNFYLDPLAEHRAVRMLGAFRPLIGAVFGAATFLVVAGGLLDVVPASVEGSPTTRLFYFSALGFVAGFNERFATGVLANAANRASEGVGSSMGGTQLPATGPPVDGAIEELQDGNPRGV